MNVKRVRIVAGWKRNSEPFVEIIYARGSGAHRDQRAVGKERAAKFGCGRRTYAGGTGSGRCGGRRGEGERLKADIVCFVDCDRRRRHRIGEAARSGLDRHRVRRCAKIVPGAKGVRGTVAGIKSLRIRRHRDGVGGIQRPTESLRRGGEGLGIDNDRKSGRIGGNGDLRGYPAVQTVDAVAIAGRIIRVIAERHAGRDRFDYRQARLGQIESGVLHDGGQIEKPAGLKIRSEQSEVPRDVGQIGVSEVERDVTGAIRALVLVQQAQGVAEFMEPSGDGAAGAAGQHLGTANHPHSGHSFAVSAFHRDIYNVRLRALGHKLNETRKISVELHDRGSEVRSTSADGVRNLNQAADGRPKVGSVANREGVGGYGAGGYGLAGHRLQAPGSCGGGTAQLRDRSQNNVALDDHHAIPNLILNRLAFPHAGEYGKRLLRSGWNFAVDNQVGGDRVIFRVDDRDRNQVDSRAQGDGGDFPDGAARAGDRKGADATLAELTHP